MRHWLEKLNAGMPTNPRVRLREKGQRRIAVTPLDKQPDPPNTRKGAKRQLDGPRSLPKLSLAFDSQNSHHPDEFREISVSIVINDPRLEQLAQQLAAAEGTTVERVVRESLLSRAGRRGLTMYERPLRERLKDLAREVDALPAKAPVDRRTAEEIMGYDERGQW